MQASSRKTFIFTARKLLADCNSSDAMILAAAAHTRHFGCASQIPWREPSWRGRPHDASDACVVGGLRMATILEFKSAQRQTAASMLSACAASESAEIVFFPGVRNARHTDETSS